MRYLLRQTFTALFACLFIIAPALAIDWPVAPFNQSQPIGNSYGEFQYYGGSPYMHPGIDIMAPAGTPIYAVKGGYVKAVLTTSAELHWRVAVGDSAGAAECDGWLYAHLDQSTIPVNTGDYVSEGEYLGDLVEWPVAGFHHLHFVKIRHSGEVWNSDWQFIGNPLDELDVIDDPDAPVFENALPGQKFAFLRNESADYFPTGTMIDGEVDIVCKVYDYVNHYDWKLAPYQLEYMISGDSSLPWTNSVCFTGSLDYSHNMEVIYQINGDLQSNGDYNNRDYYFNVTNTDGDSTIEATDRPFTWETPYFQNGWYMIYVRASDRAGNSTIDSITAYVANFFALSGRVNPGDGDPDSSGAIVTVLSTGASDTTDEQGFFEIAAVPGAWQEIEISRPGYETINTYVSMTENRNLNSTLQPNFIAGDANNDGDINIGDVVYLVNYIFKSGPVSIPYYAGDANSDDTINVGDAVYLLNYIFQNGPAPVVFLKAGRFGESVNIDS